MVSNTTSRRWAALAALAAPFSLLIATAHAQNASENIMASYICRPVIGSETANARMNSQGTALLCRPFAVGLRMDDGSMKVIGNVTSRPIPGPAYSKALTAQQVNDAWNSWIEEKFQIHGSNGGN